MAQQIEQELWITLRAPKADTKKKVWKYFWKYGKLLTVHESKLTVRQLHLVVSNTGNLYVEGVDS